MLLLYRTILLLVGGGGLLVGTLLLFALSLSWSSAENLKPLSENLGFRAGLQALNEQMTVGRRTPGGPAYAKDFREQVAAMAGDASSAALAPRTAETLQRLADALNENPTTAVAVDEGGGIAVILAREDAAYRELFEEVQTNVRREFQALLALLIVLPALSIALLVFFHRRVLAPVNDLSRFLALLARKDYVVAAADNVDPLVRPLFENYNRMVKRMHDLEQGHQKREDSLRQDVDQATRALFQQQAALSRMERLAAVGEVSARLGHELRNPLSGVLMVLINLREEIDSQDQDQRLGLAIGELERIAHLLTRVVEESRQVPERPRSLDLQHVVEEIAMLVRYQLDDEIRLETEVPKDLRCTLPESGVRHALLNLVLNAADALSGRAGTVQISAEPRDGELAIRVSDDGPGFPEELLGAGVHEFGSWRHGGTGLGLATVRRFAFANSGRLELANRAEGGAVATLVIPEADRRD
jgi:signal transduction histidine kinase